MIEKIITQIFLHLKYIINLYKFKGYGGQVGLHVVGLEQGHQQS